MGTFTAMATVTIPKLLCAPPAFLANLRSLSIEGFVPRTLQLPLYLSLLPRVLAPLLLRSYHHLRASLHMNFTCLKYLGSSVGVDSSFLVTMWPMLGMVAQLFLLVMGSHPLANMLATWLQT